MIDSTAVERKVWLLTDDRPGNRTQAVGVARALGWAFDEKRLAFNEREELSNSLLGPTLSTLDEASRALIAPPFPEFVFAAGRRVAPVAHWIGKTTKGATRVVMIGRKMPGDFADLTVRCAHFGQFPNARLLELVVPPTQVDAEALAWVRQKEPDPMASLRRPRVLFLVGGPTGQHDFDAATAEQAGRNVVAAAKAMGGGLAIVTARRTPPEALAALKRAAPEAQLHEWRAGAAYNPYLAYLANADLLVVTGESESTLGEAIAAGRPLSIYPLPTRDPGVKKRLIRRIAEVARGNSPAAPVCRWLMNRAWVMPRRDFALLHRRIEERGWGKIFIGELNLAPPAPFLEREEIVRRVLALTPKVSGAAPAPATPP